MMGGEMDAEPVRVCVWVDKDLHTRLYQRIPWGVRSQVLRTLLEMVVDAVEAQGAPVLGAILAGDLKLRYEPTVHNMNAKGAHNDSP